MAGVVGFEPTVHATKKRCLTAWLHPNSEQLPKSTWLQVQALFTAKFDWVAQKVKCCADLNAWSTLFWVLSHKWCRHSRVFCTAVFCVLIHFLQVGGSKTHGLWGAKTGWLLTPRHARQDQSNILNTNLKKQFLGFLGKRSWSYGLLKRLVNLLGWCKFFARVIAPVSSWAASRVCSAAKSFRRNRPSTMPRIWKLRFVLLILDELASQDFEKC